MSYSYWQERMAKSQQNLADKSRKQIDAQLRKYYRQASDKLVTEFENTYFKIQAAEANGRVPTPADLYNLDKYWELQGQVSQTLQKLGDKQIALLTRDFQDAWWAAYNFISLEGEAAFNSLPSAATVEQLISQIWCADGKSWSARIWQNNKLLAETLNEGLLHTIATGAPSSELKRTLMERFNVSFNRADALVRTELAHIQTQAAEQRYKDYGIKEVEIFVDEDERTCPICSKLEGKRYLVGAAVPIPAHPRCRCCIVPVVEDSKKLTETEELAKLAQEEKAQNKFGQEITFADVMTSKKKDYWQEPVDIIKKLSKEYDTRLVSVKVGGMFGGGEFNPATGIMQLGSNKPSVAIHEFGHSIATEWVSKVKAENIDDFWKEIKAVRRKYKKTASWQDQTKLSMYEAGSDIDEFVAEAFTLAKLKEYDLEIPSSYGIKADGTAKEVLGIVDKYFKKKKKK